MKSIFGLLFVLTFATSVSFAGPTAPATAPSTPKFMRFVKNPDGSAQLQAATVRYENADHVSVDLVAAVHIADPSFYRELDSSFDDYDAVLFERVQPKSATQPTTKSFGLILASLSQQMLSSATGLEHQLRAIHYENRKNFIHADMDTETLDARLAARHQSLLGSLSNRHMSREQQETQGRIGSDVLVAFLTRDPQRMKMAMGELFGEMGDMGVGDEAQPTVLVDERNRVALNVLKDVLENKKEDKSIAIFYGAAHLHGMEKILTQEMGFHQVGPPLWRTAWNIPAPLVSKPSTKPTTRSASHGNR